MGREYSVYVHTNKSDGKRYVGITSQDVERRWRKGSGYRGCAHFYNAILKYGWNEFSHETVCANLSKAQAEAMEAELIQKFDTTNPDNGYNLMAVGCASIHSEESRQKISEAMSGCNHPLYGKPRSRETKLKLSEFNKGVTHTYQNSFCGHHHTDEAKARISESRKQYVGDKNPFYGKHHTEEAKAILRESNIGKLASAETKQKISMAMSGANHPLYGRTGSNSPKAKVVINLNTLTVYGSIIDAKKMCGMSLDISRCCAGKIKYSGVCTQTGEKMKWMYYEDYVKSTQETEAI